MRQRDLTTGEPPSGRRSGAVRRCPRRAVGDHDADGSPHLVPVVFALVGETVWTAVDGKPKSTTALRRLDNVRAHPP